MEFPVFKFSQQPETKKWTKKQWQEQADIAILFSAWLIHAAQVNLATQGYSFPEDTEVTDVVVKDICTKLAGVDTVMGAEDD